MSALAPQSGAELAAMIVAAAAERRLSLKVFLRPINSDGPAWLNQLRIAQRPKAHTIERVRQLLAGEIVDQAPPNNFQKRRPDREPGPQRGRVEADPPIPDGPRLDREPCWRCGVRGDIGCSHRRAA